MSTSGDGDHQGQQEDPQTAPRDLIDFYRRWRPEFRQMVILLSDRVDLSRSEPQTIHWMILLLVRISEHDLEPLKRSAVEMRSFDIAALRIP
jgi:hypothetical protein